MSCMYAVAAMYKIGLKPEDFLHQWLTMDDIRSTYKCIPTKLGRHFKWHVANVKRLGIIIRHVKIFQRILTGHQWLRMREGHGQARKGLTDSYCNQWLKPEHCTGNLRVWLGILYILLRCEVSSNLIVRVRIVLKQFFVHVPRINHMGKKYWRSCHESFGNLIKNWIDLHMISIYY